MNNLSSVTVSRVLVVTFLLALTGTIFSSCTTDSAPTVIPVWGQCTTSLVHENLKSGDSIYQRIFAIFRDPTMDVSTKLHWFPVTSTSLNGTALAYDTTNKEYHLDSILPASSSMTWKVVGNSSIPDFTLSLIPPGSLAITNLHSRDSVTIGTTITVNWSGSVSGASIGIDIEDSTKSLSQYSVLDKGTADIIVPTMKPGVLRVFVYRVTEGTSTVGAKQFTLDAVTDALVNLIAHN